MGAPSKRARKIRFAKEFDLLRLVREIMAPKTSSGIYAWSADDIVSARDQQMLGRFKLPARAAESMRTDDAIQVAYTNRLAPQRCIKVEMVAAKGARGATVCNESEGQFGQSGVAITPDTLGSIHGCLVNHEVAFANCIPTPREDGSRIDYAVRAWPIEHVRWDPIDRCFKTLTYEGGEEKIVHGDGRWVIFQKFEVEPFKHASLLAALLVWRSHALAIRDWAKGSVSHGAAKIVGALAAGVPLQGPDGALTADAVAFLQVLRDLESSDSPVVIKPAGSEVEFITNTSTAWQVWKELVLNARGAAARIYLGTDGTLGATGGAPGVDITALFGVAATMVEGDLRCIERALLTGVIEPWTAINFGDSTLAPMRRYQIPDADEEARRAAIGTRRAAFFVDIESAKRVGFVITQEYVNDVAREYDVEPPTLPTVPTPGEAAPSATPAEATPPAPPAALRLVPPPAEPTGIEKAEHASRMTAALIADIRETRALGMTFTQKQIDETAARYGVPAPKMESK